MKAFLAANAARSLQSLKSSISPRRPPGHRFQYMSDLHLEIGQQYASFDFPVTAPMLILAGDIGRLIDYAGYLTFLERQCSRYERVFLVLGNHEFYGTSYTAGLEDAARLTQEPSLEGKAILLHRTRYDLADENSDIVVLGCTLWSEIPDAASGIIKSTVNDFKQIMDWSVETHNQTFRSELEWLRDEVRRVNEEEGGKSKTIVIATHYAPLLAKTASPKHDDSPVKAAFATDICTTEDWKSVRYWVFGHTHWTTKISINGIRVVGNQRGYVFPGNVRLLQEILPAKHTFDANRVVQL